MIFGCADEWESLSYGLRREKRPSSEGSISRMRSPSCVQRTAGANTEVVVVLLAVCDAAVLIARELRVKRSIWSERDAMLMRSRTETALIGQK